MLVVVVEDSGRIIGLNLVDPEEGIWFHRPRDQIGTAGTGRAWGQVDRGESPKRARQTKIEPGDIGAREVPKTQGVTGAGDYVGYGLRNVIVGNASRSRADNAQCVI